MRFFQRVLTCAALVLSVPAFAGNGSALLSHVPSGAQVIVGINVDAVRSSALWAHALDLADDQADLNTTVATLRAAGLDPHTAVHSVVMATNTLGPTAGDHAVAFIEADFTRDALVTVLTDDGYVATTEGSATYYRKGESAVAFLSDRVLAVGEHALVLPALQGSGGASGTVGRQATAVDKSGAIWIATAIPDGAQGAQAARASIDLSSGLRANLVVTMESAEAATTAATEFNAQIGVVAASPELQALGVAPLMTGLTAAASGTEITLTSSVSPTDLSSLLTRVTALAREELR